MTTISLNITHICIYIIIFYIIYRMSYKFLTYGESDVQRKEYRIFSHGIAMIFSLYVIVFYKAMYFLFSTTHIALTL